MKHLLLLAALMLLGACASGPTPVSPQEPAAQEGSAAGATPAVTTGGDSGGSSATVGAKAVDGLLEDARRLRGAGNLEACFARLERALRIAPRSGEVYLELARSHAAAGHDERAVASAERGLLYCSGSTCRALKGYANP